MLAASIYDIFRDAPFGQLMRYLTSERIFQHPEEKADFKLPEVWLQVMTNTVATKEVTAETERVQDDLVASPVNGETGTAAEIERQRQHTQQTRQLEKLFADGTLPPDTESGDNLQHVMSSPIVPKTTNEGNILVDWYCTDDPANPHNWSNRRRIVLTSIICAYTFVVYTTSSIYTPSEEGVMKEFGVSDIKSSLGLAIYVLGYGVGPLIFSPLSEIPLIGRNPIYIVTMFLFVVLSIPTALVRNFPGLIILRFLQGFFGSPCLASGGASLGDMYSLMHLPFAMIAWVASAYCGPALGPLLSGFAVPVKGWRWSLYESIWASSPILITMFLFLPETSGPNILLRRAQRLRKTTGDSRFMSQSEMDQRHMTISALTVDALVKPMEISLKDPAVLFVQVYTAILYGIYYSFFEVFPLVYPVFYHMNLGQVGLVFICALVGALVAVIVYGFLLHFVVIPQTRAKGMGSQENVLVPGLFAAFGPTIGLFMFAWTARVSIHWIAPTIGISIYSGSTFIITQCLFVYIYLSYPQYAASIFAANDFLRSALASGSILFAHPLFGNLGVHKGTSLLGGLSVTGIIGIWLLFVFGAKLRSLSHFAVYTPSE